MNYFKSSNRSVVVCDGVEEFTTYVWGEISTYPNKGDFPVEETGVIFTEITEQQYNETLAAIYGFLAAKNKLQNQMDMKIKTNYIPLK